MLEGQLLEVWQSDVTYRIFIHTIGLLEPNQPTFKLRRHVTALGLVRGGSTAGKRLILTPTFLNSGK